MVGGPSSGLSAGNPEAYLSTPAREERWEWAHMNSQSRSWKEIDLESYEVGFEMQN